VTTTLFMVFTPDMLRCGSLRRKLER